MAQSGDVSGSIPLFVRVTELSPSFVLGHYGLGKAYLRVDGRTEDAVKELKKAVECDRSFSKAWFYLGMAHTFSKDYANAIDAFQGAYRADRSCIEALYNIGAVFDIMGHSFKSKKFFNAYFTAMSGGSEPF